MASPGRRAAGEEITGRKAATGASPSTLPLAARIRNSSYDQWALAGAGVLHGLLRRSARKGCSTRLRVAGHVRLVVQRAAATQERYDLVDQRL